MKTVTLARVLALGLVAVANIARADDWPPAHHCRKPIKPYRFTSEYEVDSFKNDVEAYERCIDEFVRQQQEAAQTHKDAAKKAIDEWNRFVRFELG
jgi:hypothetical protein